MADVLLEDLRDLNQEYVTIERLVIKDRNGFLDFPVKCNVNLLEFEGNIGDFDFNCLLNPPNQI